MKYRKKPVTIEAVQFFTEKYKQSWANYPMVQDRNELTTAEVPWIPNGGPYFVNTLEGCMAVSDGDFIVKGVENELYAVKPDIFKKTYEAVEE